MACGTHVVGWASYGGKEYINNENGFWAMNGDTFQVVELLTVAVEKWVTGEIDDQASSIQEKYEETLKNYTYENQSNQIIQIIEQTKIERINELNHAKNQ
jgi:glycosyltransferase involved in cell wall biosynthesis